MPARKKTVQKKTRKPRRKVARKAVQKKKTVKPIHLYSKWAADTEAELAQKKKRLKPSHLYSTWDADYTDWVAFVEQTRRLQGSKGFNKADTLSKRR